MLRSAMSGSPVQTVRSIVCPSRIRSSPTVKASGCPGVRTRRPTTSRNPADGIDRGNRTGDRYAQQTQGDDPTVNFAAFKNPKNEEVIPAPRWPCFPLHQYFQVVAPKFCI